MMQGPLPQNNTKGTSNKIPWDKVNWTEEDSKKSKNAGEEFLTALDSLE